MRRSRITIVLAVAAAAAGITGFLRAADSAAPSRVPTPAAEPTAEAAVAAATSFLSAMDLATVLDDRRREVAIRATVAPEARGRLMRLYDAEKRRIATSYMKAPRVARAALAGYRVRRMSPSRASVAIWAATIGGSADLQPVSGWSTTTVSLRWLDPAWLVTDVQHAPGPSPSWPVQTLAERTRQFREYQYAP